MKEAHVQAAIRNYLSMLGAAHVRQVAGSITRGGRVVAQTRPGVSDLLCCVPFRLDELSAAGMDRIGVFVAVETKPPGWRPPGPKAKARPHYERQRDFLAEIRRAGGIGIFAPTPETFIRELGLTDYFIC